MITKKISLVRYISYTSVSILLYWILISYFVNKENPVSSLFTHCISAFISLVVYSLILLRDAKETLIVSIVFILKLFIGLWHYLYFIDPNYFITPFHMLMHDEYKVYYYAICTFADAKEYELFVQPENLYLVTHPELLNIISFVFYRCGNYILTIMPLNTMMSLYTAVSIAYVSKKHIYIAKQIKVILVLTSLSPFCLIPSLFTRDIVGQFLITVGVVFVVLSNKNRLFLMLSLLIASFLFYLQRTPYCIIPILTYLLFVFISKNEKRMTKILLLLFAVLSVMEASIFLSDIEKANSIYISIFSNIYAIALFPVKFIIGIIGPFPWIQFIESYEYSYQLQDYLMSVLLISTLRYIFPYIKERVRLKEGLDFMTWVAFILIIFGIMNPFMHMSYVSIGVIFLMPVLSKIVTLKKYSITFLKVFLLYLFANILYLSLNLHGSGFSKLFR